MAFCRLCCTKNSCLHTLNFISFKTAIMDASTSFRHLCFGIRWTKTNRSWWFPWFMYFDCGQIWQNLLWSPNISPLMVFVLVKLLNVMRLISTPFSVSTSHIFSHNASAPSVHDNISETKKFFSYRMLVRIITGKYCKLCLVCNIHCFINH